MRVGTISLQPLHIPTLKYSTFDDNNHHPRISLKKSSIHCYYCHHEKERKFDIKVYIVVGYDVGE